MNTDITQEGVILKLSPLSPCNNYRAGSDGQVYSNMKRKNYKGYLGPEWLPLRGCKDKTGYPRLTLFFQGKKYYTSIHRFICAAFHGEPPTKSHEVRHLDGSRDNNQPDNLCWGTQIDNWLDRKAHGRGCEGEKHPMAKLSNFEMQALKWAIDKGLCSQRHAARMLNITQSAVYHVVRRDIPTPATPSTHHGRGDIRLRRRNYESRNRPRNIRGHCFP